MDEPEGNLITRPAFLDDEPPSPTPAVGTRAANPFWHRTKVRIAALSLVAVAVGGGVTAAVESGGSSSGTTASGASQAVGAAPTGTGGAPGGAAGGAGGAAPSQYRLSGTVTAVSSSSITIKSSSGTSTVYTTTSATRLVRNGSTVTLSSFAVGDSVIGSVTASGSTVLSDLMVGSAGGPGGAGGAPPAA